MYSEEMELEYFLMYLHADVIQRMQMLDGAVARLHNLVPPN